MIGQNGFLRVFLRPYGIPHAYKCQAQNIFKDLNLSIRLNSRVFQNEDKNEGSVLVVAPQTHPPLKVYFSPILTLVLLYTSEGGPPSRKCTKVYSTETTEAVGQQFCRTTQSCTG